MYVISFLNHIGTISLYLSTCLCIDRLIDRQRVRYFKVNIHKSTLRIHSGDLAQLKIIHDKWGKSGMSWFLFQRDHNLQLYGISLLIYRFHTWQTDITNCNGISLLIYRFHTRQTDITNCIGKTNYMLNTLDYKSN